MHDLELRDFLIFCLGLACVSVAAAARAAALAEELFDDESHMVRLDMSEYQPCALDLLLSHWNEAFSK